MDVTVNGGHPQGYHFTFDEVQNAMMRAAAFMFTGYRLEPAAHPTQFIYGRASLYSPESMDYGGSYGVSGMDMLQTVYQYGVRIKIDPTRETDQVIGPVVTFANRNRHNPYTPTRQITFDHKKGYLSLDAPAAVAWTGLLANYGPVVKFAGSGVVLRDLELVNPPGSADPIRADQKYVAFALYSRDGLPLNKTKKASLSLVSTSFNSGFVMGTEYGAAKSGGLPVLVTRVGGVVESPALRGMRYRLLDWHFQEIGGGVIRGTTLTIPAAKPVFVVELER